MKKPEIRFGQVLSVDDETGGGRIQVAISYEDRDDLENAMKSDPSYEIGKGNTLINYAFPWNPKFIHIMPKVGENVFIINQQLDESHTQRYYVGPIIAQPQYMYKNYYKDSTRILAGSNTGAAKNPDYERTSPGTQPNKEDIALLGRKDSDIILKDDEIHIRCGVKNTTVLSNWGSEYEFNGRHPSFIKLQHVPTNLPEKDSDFEATQEEIKKKKEMGYESVINLAADKINLIGTDSRELYKVNDPDKLISDEEVQKFIKKAHQVPYGDTLVEFLEIFRTAFLTHQHPWAQLPPTRGEDVKRLTNYQLNSMLSQTIRIN